MIIVNKTKCDGYEFLPYPEEVIQGDPCSWSKIQKRNYDIYKAIRDSEMYFQENTPTAYGNPKYSFYEGTLYGLIIGYDLELNEVDGYICISKGKKTIMKVEKLKLPDSFHEAIREYNNLLNEVFG